MRGMMGSIHTPVLSTPCGSYQCIIACKSDHCHPVGLCNPLWDFHGRLGWLNLLKCSWLHLLNTAGFCYGHRSLLYTRTSKTTSILVAWYILWNYALVAFAAGAVPPVPEGCGCSTATRALVKGAFCQCLCHIFPSSLQESNSKHRRAQQSGGSAASRGGARAAGAAVPSWGAGSVRQCHQPVCRSNAASALLMSFQTAVSFTDAKNLLIALIHLCL